MKYKRSLKTGLLFERCTNCNNVLELIGDPGQLACWCNFGLCISCTHRPPTHYNLCEACDAAYRRDFSALRYAPRSAKSVEAWIRQAHNNLFKRREVRVSFEDFQPWWYRAHRSLRLNFQNRGGRFEIHCARDIGPYTLGRIFMIPRSENNAIRDCRGIERIQAVTSLKHCTLDVITRQTGIAQTTAWRMRTKGLTIIEPRKVPFLSE
jgi:hypothetical protein